MILVRAGAGAGDARGETNEFLRLISDGTPFLRAFGAGVWGAFFLIGARDGADASSVPSSLSSMSGLIFRVAADGT